MKLLFAADIYFLLRYFARKHVVTEVEMYAVMIHLHARSGCRLYSISDSCDWRGS